MSEASIGTAGAAEGGGPDPTPIDGPRRSMLRRYGPGALFLAPALVVLVVWIVYPTVYTVVRSFYGKEGFSREHPFGDFVGIDNYRTLFTTSSPRSSPRAG